MATSSTAGEVDALLSDHSTSNRGPEMLGACITSMIFCVIGLSIRVWAQSLIHRIWTVDCILIILAAIFTLATAGCVIAAVASGMGQHAVRGPSISSSLPPGFLAGESCRLMGI